MALSFDARLRASEPLRDRPVIVLSDLDLSVTRRAFDLDVAERLLVITDEPTSFGRSRDHDELIVRPLLTKRAWQRELRSPDVVEHIDQWDPHREAVVVAPSRLSVGDGATLLGRPLLYGRRQEWFGSERKLHVDETFRSLQIPHPTSRVVRSHDEAREAMAWFADRCALVVVSHDGPEVTSGGQGVNIVDVRQPYELNRPSRIAEFVPGHLVSMSAVAAGKTVTFPAVEEFALIDMDGNGAPWLVGCSSIWQLPSDLRAAISNDLERFIAHERDAVGFKGLASWDIVVSHDLTSYRVLEANMRPGDTIDNLSEATGIAIESYDRLAIAGRLTASEATELAEEVEERLSERGLARGVLEVESWGSAGFPVEVSSAKRNVPVAPLFFAELERRAAEMGQSLSGIPSYRIDNPRVLPSPEVRIPVRSRTRGRPLRLEGATAHTEQRPRQQLTSPSFISAAVPPGTSGSVDLSDIQTPVAETPSTPATPATTDQGVAFLD